MQFIIWSLCFLVFFAATAYFRLHTFANKEVALSCLLEQLQEQRQAFSKQEKLRFETTTNKPEISTKNPIRNRLSTQPAEPLLYLEFPPPHAKLNLAVMVREHKVKREEQRIIFERLLRNLYKEEDFVKGRPLFAQEISLYLVEQLDLKIHKISSDLATLSWQDPELQEIFYKILKGKKGQYPSLLDFVTLSPNRLNRRIHVHLAPTALLAALFDNQVAADLLDAKRSQLHKEGMKRTKSCKKRLVTPLFLKQEEVSAFLDLHGVSPQEVLPLLDFQVGMPRSFTPLP